MCDIYREILVNRLYATQEMNHMTTIMNMDVHTNNNMKHIDCMSNNIDHHASGWRSRSVAALVQYNLRVKYCGACFSACYLGL